MELDLLTAISPIDGRYRGKAGALASYFSEFALIKYRVQVEIEYFITLCELPLPQLKDFDHARFDALRAIYKNFSEADAQRIKEIESVTNHDVKAVEYFIKEEFDKLGGMEECKEFIHFGLTSQDINNTSVPLSIKEALEQVYYPQIEELIAQLTTYAEEWANIPMLAKTHGQPASPTRLGKEIMVFVYRLNRQLAVLKACPVTAKFGGATGNYNAHHVASIFVYNIYDEGGNVIDGGLKGFIDGKEVVKASWDEVNAPSGIAGLAQQANGSWIFCNVSSGSNSYTWRSIMKSNNGQAITSIDVRQLLIQGYKDVQISSSTVENSDGSVTVSSASGSATAAAW